MLQELPWVIIEICINENKRDKLKKYHLVSTSCECKVVDFGSVGPFQEGGGWGSNFRRGRGLKGGTGVSLLLPVDGDRGRHARLGLQEGVELEAGRGFWPTAHHSRDTWTYFLWYLETYLLFILPTWGSSCSSSSNLLCPHLDKSETVNVHNE